MARHVLAGPLSEDRRANVVGIGERHLFRLPSGVLAGVELAEGLEEYVLYDLIGLAW